MKANETFRFLAYRWHRVSFGQVYRLGEPFGSFFDRGAFGCLVIYISRRNYTVLSL